MVDAKMLDYMVVRREFQVDCGALMQLNPASKINLWVESDIYCIYALNISLYKLEWPNTGAWIWQHCTRTITGHQGINLFSAFEAIGRTHCQHAVLSAALRSGFFLFFLSAQTQSSNKVERLLKNILWSFHFTLERTGPILEPWVSCFSLIEGRGLASGYRLVHWDAMC